MTPAAFVPFRPLRCTERTPHLAGVIKTLGHPNILHSALLQEE